MIYEERISSATRKAFTDKVQAIANKYGFRADWLMIVMYFETGGKFNTGHHGNGAWGLIGFRSTVAVELGTSTAALAKMTQVQQLDYVDKYLRKWNAGAKVKDLTDLYMIVFSPAFAGKPDTFVLYRSGSAGYTANYKAFDPTGRGFFTVGDVGKVIARFAGNVPTGNLPIWLVLAMFSAATLALKNFV
ncbi:hypothetical protein [Runella limosa]|uniref:hypothetical protein n=1 Tax=Runella limosa TaxID=370978 RepID=UPI00040C32F3|nr:hypothetical protein [Runella limosa]